MRRSIAGKLGSDVDRARPQEQRPGKESNKDREQIVEKGTAMMFQRLQESAQIMFPEEASQPRSVGSQSDQHVPGPGDSEHDDQAQQRMQSTHCLPQVSRMKHAT